MLLMLSSSMLDAAQSAFVVACWMELPLVQPGAKLCFSELPEVSEHCDDEFMPLTATTNPFGPVAVIMLPSFVAHSTTVGATSKTSSSSLLYSSLPLSLMILHRIMMLMVMTIINEIIDMIMNDEEKNRILHAGYDNE